MAPTDPAGVTAVTEVGERTTTLVASKPPIVTRFALVKLVPVIVIAVPAASGPEIGLTVTIVGAAKYVNAFVLVALPPTVVTEISFRPAVPTGVIAEMELLDTTITLVAAVPPTVTLLVFVKLVPVIVIGVPAVSGPEIGLTLTIVGAAT